ncbi:Regulator of G protein signaling [Phytophthora cinnamomi]|uniref:Regulator of G protein signaling n=1 Tax=Phytophthora cinnamomi TaxID=4785 RepID=UPI00355A6F1A|nr:Regulator of G protein signaling [Phytophthora cinnamomi]
MQAFRKFLVFQHCSESLMLWEIEHYWSYQIVRRSAKKIYGKSLNPNNPRSHSAGAVKVQLEVVCRTASNEVGNECSDHMRTVMVLDFLGLRIFMVLGMLLFNQDELDQCRSPSCWPVPCPSYWRRCTRCW